MDTPVIWDEAGGRCLQLRRAQQLRLLPRVLPRVGGRTQPLSAQQTPQSSSHPRSLPPSCLPLPSSAVPPWPQLRAQMLSRGSAVPVEPDGARAHTVGRGQAARAALQHGTRLGAAGFPSPSPPGTGQPRAHREERARTTSHPLPVESLPFVRRPLGRLHRNRLQKGEVSRAWAKLAPGGPQHVMGQGCRRGVLAYLQRQEGEGVLDQQPHQALGVEDEFVPGRVLVPAGGQAGTERIPCSPLQPAREGRDKDGAASGL